MPYKDPEVRKAKAREYSARHYAANAAKVKAVSRGSRTVARQAWREYKSSLACVTCSFAHPDVLDFHHLPSFRSEPDKQAVNFYAARGQFRRAYEEAAKCVPLCSNCHRLGHFLEHAGMPARAPAPLGRLYRALAPYFLVGKAKGGTK
jgi:hypothetical protein